MQRRWKVPDLHDAAANLNLPYPEVDTDLSSDHDNSQEADYTATASTQTPSQEQFNIYDGLSERLESFVIFTAPADEANQVEKERIVHQATIQFYRRTFLQQESNTLGSTTDPSPNEFCRICRDTDSKERFLSPCRCKGTLAFVHLSCLERWLAESDTSVCELCGHQYTAHRTPRYSILKSVVLWLGHGSPRDLLFDAVAFCAFTPLAVVGTYLGVMAGDAYYRYEDRELDSTLSHLCTRVIILGLVSLMAAIDFAYMTWFFVRIQQHAAHWYSWWRRHSAVRVILPPEDLERKRSSDKETKEPSSRE